MRRGLDAPCRERLRPRPQVPPAQKLASFRRGQKDVALAWVDVDDVALGIERAASSRRRDGALRRQRRIENQRALVRALRRAAPRTHGARRLYGHARRRDQRAARGPETSARATRRASGCSTRTAPRKVRAFARRPRRGAKASPSRFERVSRLRRPRAMTPSRTSGMTRTPRSCVTCHSICRSGLV